MLNRREFFHSLLNYGKQKDENLFVLPPYNFNRSLFYKFCQECQKDCVDACSRVCKEGIIKSNGKSVYVDFRVDGCKLCGECAIACPNGVLEVGEEGWENRANWNVAIVIEENLCIAHQKTMCYTCKDICQSVLGISNAIEFIGLFYPKINQECIGCGMCIKSCPTNAIGIRERENV
ncbi:4Fe-4S binding protein [Helicobacter apodemus]|uniref:Nitrate reductase n=1 Tax=Helicobacter apodemus TaxID=135569 RepID=A0A2U8FBZ4_9HELI|nr:4Fe-4S binding protein [Helicobacter apodemus]AWI33770.1 nitrate reductase [Helicobacter apodemus]